MKIKLFFTAIFACCVLSFSSLAQIKILSNGEINLGNTNGTGYFILNYTGYCGGGPVLYPSSTGSSVLLGKQGYYFGAVYTYSIQYPSDLRYKENIRQLTGALSIIKSIKGVKYDYTANFFNDNKDLQKQKGKDQLGFIAQDLQKVLPQVVTHDDSTDMYSIDYIRIIPVLVEAIKEQQMQIDSLKKLLNKPKSTLKSLITEENTLNAELNTVNSSYLEQNIPNPFSQRTIINFYIAENTKNAYLYVYNMNGVQVKSFPLTSKGKGSITIEGGELSPGMYYYTLITDGREIDTKKMILTQN